MYECLNILGFKLYRINALLYFMFQAPLYIPKQMPHVSTCFRFYNPNHFFEQHNENLKKISFFSWVICIELLSTMNWGENLANFFMHSFMVQKQFSIMPKENIYLLVCGRPVITK